MVTGKTTDQEVDTTAIPIQAPDGIFRRLANRWGLPLHSLGYFAAIAVTCLLIFGQNLYAAKSLGPELYGIWNIFAITYSYSLFAHVGVLNGLAREYPRAAADDDWNEAQQLTSSAFWVSGLGTLLFAAIALVALAFGFRGTPEVTSQVLFLFVAFLLVQGWTNFQLFDLRARNQFNTLSALTVCLNAGVLIGAVLLTPRWKLEGFVSAWAIAYLITSILFFRKITPHAWGRPNWQLVSHLWRVGGPILLFTLTATINWTLDRLLIARFFGVVAVGHFAVAAFAVRLLSYVPELVGQIMYPYWAAASLSRSGVRSGLCAAPFRVVFWLMPLLAGLAYYACLFIPVFLPSYRDSVQPSQVLCLSASLMSVGLFCGSYLGASGREKEALRVQVLTVVVRVIGVGSVLMIGKTLFQVALASGFSAAAFGVSLLWITSRHFQARWRFIVEGFLPWLLSCVWLFLIEAIRRGFFSEPHAITPGVVIGATLFAAGLLMILKLVTGWQASPLLLAPAAAQSQF